MAHVVVMPKLGNTVESCIIVKWNVSVGGPVKTDTILCEIETDKATMDVPAGVEGTLLARLKQEGDDVPVLEPIAVVGAVGETIELGAPGAQLAETASLRGVSPRAKALARAEGLPLGAIASGSGPGGRIIERDVRDTAALSGLYGAANTGGSGLGGRLTAADLKAAKAAPARRLEVVSPAASPVSPYTDTPIKSIRKIIADRMMHSLQASAQITLNSSAPAERLLALRSRFKNSDPALGFSGVTIGDMVAFAATRVLATYPKLNAHVVDGVVRSWAQIHLGLAVDTARGLMVPVLRDAASLSLRQFSGKSKLLAQSCIAGSPDPDLLSGSTFTVTNLGAFGIESFTPILNEPETGILGVDAIMPRPTIGPGGAPAVEMRIGFSLTVDHRVVDGADGARFLKELADLIANIDMILLASAEEGKST